MRMRMLCLTTMLSCLFVGVAFGADTYTIDAVHSSIAFSIQHLVINHVHGNFTEVSGNILYDEADITKSSVGVTLQASSINTNNANRDKDLRSANFFDVEKYPTITFKSTRIEKQEGGWVCVGTLTMHGVSKEIAVPFTITGKIKDPWGKTRIGIEGELTLNRQDFGISWNKMMEGGGLVIANKVKVTLNVEAVQQ